MKLLAPPNYDGLGGNDRVIFLAGPMKGAGPWQMEAAELIHQTDPSIVIATPRRPEGILDEENFEKRDQVRWEGHLLARTAFHGAQLYWYPEQSHEVLEDGKEFVRPYGKTTGKELFKWWGRKAVHNEIQLVLGADPDFSSLDYEKEMSGWDMAEIPIVETLEEACRIAVEQAHVAKPIEDFQFWTPNSPVYVSR